MTRQHTSQETSYISVVRANTAGADRKDQKDNSSRPKRRQESTSTSIDEGSEADVISSQVSLRGCCKLNIFPCLLNLHSSLKLICKVWRFKH